MSILWFDPATHQYSEILFAQFVDNTGSYGVAQNIQRRQDGVEEPVNAKEYSHLWNNNWSK